MSEAGVLLPLPLDTWGGLLDSSEMPPQNVPAGGATACADTQYLENGVQTRPGLVSQAALLAPGNPTVNYLKSFTDLSGNNYLLWLDSLGNMRSEFPQGTVTNLTSGLAGLQTMVANARARSTTLFGREYQAIHDGKFGVDFPRQFDSTNYDRVSQGGPGAPPTVVDAAAESAFNIVAATGAARLKNTVTITTTAPHGYVIGQQVNIAGVTDASFNANGFTILTVPSTTTFTYAQQAADATSGNGTSTLAPQVVAGTHGVSVAFITRQGHITKPAPTGNYVALGGRRASVSQIATGPPNVVSRVLMFTAAGFQNYFSVQPGTQPAASMVIMDNTTTSITLDFSDATLLSGQTQDYLFKLRVLGECAGVIDYSNRLFWWGERNSIQQFVNLDFDGGFGTGAPVSANTAPIAPTVGGSGNASLQPLANSAFFNSTGFGFAIPSNATILGFKVVANVHGSSAVDLSDFSVLMLKAGVAVGADHANGNIWSNVSAPQTYGGSADLWGAAWTPADVNNANFGMAYSFVNNNTRFIRVGTLDSVTITVYYKTPPAAGLPPLGWTQGASFTGGDSALNKALLAYWGDAFAITGDGVTAIRGQVTQTAFQDYLQVPILSTNTGYRVRARVASAGGLAQGTLHISLQSTSGGFTTPGLAVQAGQLTGTYTEFIGLLTSPLSSIPSDLVLQVYADGTPTSGGTFLIDNIEIYPTITPTNFSLVRASRNTVSLGPQPEAYDAINGVLQVYQQDGQRVTNAFRQREKLYFVKERALYVTADDNTSEPSAWTVSQVSSRVGTPSSRGVGIGEDWVVIASRDGLYIFWGPQPEKLTKEIQPLWNQINWNFGHTIWVTVDTLLRRIYVGVPLGTATSPNRILMMDYRGLDSAADIAAHASIHFSAYSGKVLALGNARKWSPWFITANDGDMVERNDGTKQFFVGNGGVNLNGVTNNNGKIYQLVDVSNFANPATFGDDGVAINGFTQTYYFPSIIEEQQFQLGGHRKLFGYLTLTVEGSGGLNLKAVTPAGVNFTLPTLNLYSPAGRDQELLTNVLWERIAFNIGTNAVGAWFRISKITPSVMADPHAPVRGWN